MIRQRHHREFPEWFRWRGQRGVPRYITTQGVQHVEHASIFMLVKDTIKRETFYISVSIIRWINPSPLFTWSWLPNINVTFWWNKLTYFVPCAEIDVLNLRYIVRHDCNIDGAADDNDDDDDDYKKKCQWWWWIIEFLPRDEYETLHNNLSLNGRHAIKSKKLCGGCPSL